MSVTYSAAGLFAKDLFPGNPTVFVNQVDPVFEDLEAGDLSEVQACIILAHIPQVIVPFSDMQEVEPFVPVVRD